MAPISPTPVRLRPAKSEYMQPVGTRSGSHLKGGYEQVGRHTRHPGYPSYYGGFETLVRVLAPYLVDQGWDVTVYGHAGSTKVDDPHADPRVRTLVTSGWESKSLSTLSYGLTSTARAARERPDVALIMNVANGYWLPLLKARGIPTALNVDGIEWERAKWGRLAKNTFRGGARMTALLADRLIFDSSAIAGRWSADFNRDGDFIPYGGTTPATLAPVEGLATGPYALMIARFVPENTVAEFFEAAERLSDKWDVVIVGSTGHGGEFDSAARRLADSSPRIHWLGHISDDNKLFALWQHAGVYFHGHSVGGTNPALVQAMACGAPIVARDTVYNREVLGDAGTFVDPDGAAIAKALDQTLSDPQRQTDLRNRAYRRQKANYTWEQVCNSYERSLLDIAREVSPQQSV